MLRPFYCGVSSPIVIYLVVALFCRVCLSLKIVQPNQKELICCGIQIVEEGMM